MPQTLQDLLIKLLSPIISLLLGFFLERWKNYISKKRPLSKIWGFDKEADEIFIVLTDFTQLTSEYARPTTGVGEILAFRFINESFEQAFNTTIKNLKFSDEFPKEHNDKDIILIGGPKHNLVSRYFRDRFPNLPLYFKYDEDPTVVMDRRMPDEVFKPILEPPTRDYGVISRLPNPNSSDGNVVFLIEGTHTYGLAAAGRLFTQGFFSELAKETKTVQYWQVLIETTIDGIQVAPKIIQDHFIPLDKVQLKTVDLGEVSEKISYNQSVKSDSVSKEKFVIFCDIGNVLIETTPLIRDAVRFASERCRKESKVFQEVDPEIFTSTYLLVDKNTSRPHINHLFGDYFVTIETLKRINGVADIRYAGFFLSIYRSYIRKHIRPNPEVSSFFRKLSRLANIELGIISDGTTDDQLETLKNLGLMDYLNSNLILISEEFGEEKINTKIFAEGLRRSSSKPQYTFMVGDNFDRDILFSKETGMRTAFFTKYVTHLPKYTEKTKPDIICDNFDSLFTLLYSEYLKYLSAS